MTTYFTNDQDIEANETICGNCGNFPGGDLGTCNILLTSVSKYRPAEDCIDWNPIKELKDRRQSILINIDVKKIFPHPDNPRKDLGDLTELAESIKTRGILQNLTVVPKDGMNSITDFTVVIGHRRLAAAKLAGLADVPCVISDMDHREQVATMLLENIQRNDLTPIEQAQGFQMMMDLGETITGISEKTGFSDATIRKRLNLVKLDQKKLHESYLRGGTLMDYAKLEQLKDEKAKNKVLESIGTRDFDWNLKNAIDKQEEPERKKKLMEILDTFAKKIKSQSDIKGGSSYEKNFNGFRMDNWNKPKDADTAEYFYTVDNWGASLYKKVEKAVPKKTSAKEKEFNRREAELKKLSKQAYEMRYEFIRNFAAGKKHAKEIQDFVFRRLLRYHSADNDKLLKLLSIEAPDTKEMDYTQTLNYKQDLIFARYSEAPERVMLAAAYIGLNDTAGSDYFQARGWENRIIHERNSTLDSLYDTLVSLDYEMSTEEQQLRDGTHELLDKPKDPPKNESEPIPAEDGLYYCTQDDCPFNDRESGCQFDPKEAGEPRGEVTWEDDVAEAANEYNCENPELLAEYKKLDPEIVSKEEQEESANEV
jgi:ParB-like partition proteins